MKKTMQKGQRLLALLIAVWCFCATAWAQNATIKGVVVDSQGESIIGATVVLKSDKTVGTTTDLDGNFTLKVPSAKSTLVVSYVGMKTVEVAGNGKTLRIILDEDNEQLEEVIVVGYGQQKKASVVGAITQASGKTLERAAGITSVGAALTGNLPGVVTMTSSAVPGEEDPKIVIRGSSSWNNSEPLVLVDGIERPMSSVDMGSVENISVLKDASATAVYGVRGANGVILITTKRGQEGRPSINVSANAIMKVPSALPGKADSYDAYMMRNIALEHEMNLNPGSWENYRPMSFIENFRNQTTQEQKERYPNVDWQKLLFKDYCMSYNASINVSGGTKHVRYFAAVDYVNEGDLFETFDSGRGYTPKYGYNRINVRSNLDFHITNTTVLKVDLSGSTGITEATYENANLDDWQVSQQFAGAFNLAPDVFLPRYSDGSYGYYPLVSNVTNSVEKFTLAGTNKTTNSTINTNFTLEQDLKFITPGLSFRGNVAWDNRFQEKNRGINDLYNNAQRTWVDPETGLYQHTQDRDANQQFDFSEGRHWSISNGSVQDWATTRNLYYQLQLNWNRKFGKHDLSAMGLFNRSEYTTGSNPTSFRESWAFRATYNYADRYNAEYNGAYNGSEKFASKYRFGFFQSGAVGWTITNEPFMKAVKDLKWGDNHVFDFLKLRYSYGEIGDDNVAGRWLFMNSWAYGGTTKLDVNQGSSVYQWYREASLGNPDIHWEVVRKHNFGVDYSFLGGMVAGSVDIFKDTRSDVIVGANDRAIPSYFGTGAPTANLGKVKTNGYEIELRLNKTFHGGHRVWANMSMTHAENEVIKKDDKPLLPNYQKSQGYAIGQPTSHINNGFINSVDELYGSPKHDSSDGQKLVGDYYIVDFNGDGKIDLNDSAPYGYTGTPENTYNATIGYEWKGFSCFVQFYGVTNVNRYVGLGSFGDKLNAVFDQGSWWSQEGSSADVVTPRYNTTPSYYYGTQMNYDGSYIRLKNIEMAYTWNKGWVKKIGLTNLRLFVSANNLWMYTNMPDDREANGAQTSAYPTVKRINFGLKFSL